jgi:hypothetical protein|tara:strand:+ start:601 stop:1242 length:642 start_codon:yes stop_codon:yes gene_type:complete
MALTKFNFNSFDLTTVASTGLAFNSNANGFDTAAAGAMTLLTTNTISSGVSSSNFTSSINSTYDTYVFKLINIHPASQAFLGFNFSIDGGSNYNATKTSTNFRGYYSEAGTSLFSYTDGDDIAQGTGLVLTAGNLGNGTDEASSGELFLFSPSSTTFTKHFIFRSSSVQSAPAAFNCFVAGYVNTTSAVNAVQFAMSSGNIDSGVIKMYGITK